MIAAHCHLQIFVEMGMGDLEVFQTDFEAQASHTALQFVTLLLRSTIKIYLAFGSAALALARSFWRTHLHSMRVKLSGGFRRTDCPTTWSR